MTMKKEEIKMKRILALTFITLFMFSMTIEIASAAWYDNLWSGWKTGKFEEGAAKILLAIIIALTVFSISTNIPGLENIFSKDKEWLGFIFSAIVGFLSMAYITPDEVYAIMISYSGLGFVLGGGLPFIILLFFTITLATEGGGGAKGMLFRRILAYLLWGGFAIFLIYRVVTHWNSPEAETIYGALTWILLIIVIVFFLGLGYLFTKIKKMASKEEVNKYQEDINKQTSKLKADVNALEDVATSP